MLNKFIAHIIPLMPEKFIWLFSKRYIAGKYLEDAVSTSKLLNENGVEVTIDVLGEYISKTIEAVEYKQNYFEAIDAIYNNKLKASLSAKPSMFGLLIDKEFCFNQLDELVKRASTSGLSVCIDMEDSSCTDNEIELFKNLYHRYPGNVTFVMQAYLRRTLSDLKAIKQWMNPSDPINIRICKGIYNEPEDLAYKKHSRINANYLECLEFMMQNGFYCSIASHDKYLINKSLELIKKYNLDPGMYEFQMLYGVTPKLRDMLVKEGHRMRIYVPYGINWFGYSTRRLKENPRMVTHIIKALFSSQ